MYSFDEIASRTSSHKSHTDFNRTKEMQAQYDKHRAEVLQKYATLDDFILRFAFKYACYVDNGSKLKAIRPYETVLKWIWTPNSFPYDLVPNVQHFLIWSNRALTEQEIISIIGENVSKDKRYHWFVNDPQYRTIPSVHHAHVLVTSSSL
jgi:hypothetical protein